MKYILIGTEGIHDQMVICKLLGLCGLEKFRGDSDLLNNDPFQFWKDLIPVPKQKQKQKQIGNIYERVDTKMPRIFSSSTHSVAIYQGGGNNLAQNLADIFAAYDQYFQDIDGLGIVIDADNSQPAIAARRYHDKLKMYFTMLDSTPGHISGSKPRTGIYVLPDNNRKGTLDTLLVECATKVYPDHLKGATKFIGDLDGIHKRTWKPFDGEKAILSAIVSIIRPGAVSYLSFGKDAWLSEETKRNVPGVASLYDFLQKLLG